ncbi:MAG: PPC domain-containing protein [Candidatus Caldarchaeales archaeon]
MKKKVLAIIAQTIFLAFSLYSVYALSRIEPGIGFSTATELHTGTYDLYMDGTRDHFFKIWLDTNQILHIVLRVPSEADFDLYLLSPERELIESSDLGRGYYERISYQASSSGYYYIVVVPFLGSSGLYTITLRVEDLPTSTVTTTITEKFPVYETISRPIITVETVTKTVYETVRTTHVEYIERFPWMFLGLMILSVSIIIGLGMVLESLKTIMEKTSQKAS